MTEGTYVPGEGRKITPAVLVSPNRFVGIDDEQITVSGSNVRGFAPTGIAAGTDGVIFDWQSGSYLVEAGALIAARQWVMSDANGRAILYVAAAGNKIAGFCVTGASAATHKVEVFPIPPQLWELTPV